MKQSKSPADLGIVTDAYGDKQSRIRKISVV